MTKESSTLPEYERPPVTEVVCGVLFRPLDRLLVPHLGQFWQRLLPDYPKCQEVAPLLPMIEQFGDSSQPGAISFTDVPSLPRIWFIEDSGNGLVQVQRDRLLHNWRKVRQDDRHPRYHSVLGAFEKHLTEFRSFVNELQLGEIEPLQYELTYVNHILQSEGWSVIGDIGNVFPDFAWRSGEPRFLPLAEAINLRAAFAMPDQLGRLHVSIRRAQRQDDGRSLFLLELTARGIGSDRSFGAMPDWFDLAHEWIVRGFTDLTATEIQETVWRRKR